MNYFVIRVEINNKIVDERCSRDSDYIEGEMIELIKLYSKHKNAVFYKGILQPILIKKM
jgi:transcription termination factor NusB